MALTIHAQDLCPDVVSAKVRLGQNARTPSGRIAAHRVEARQVAATRLARALVNTGTSVSEYARSLGIDEKAVRRWLDPEEVSSPAIGDLEAGKAAVWREYLRLAAEELESAPAMCPKSAVLALAGKVGELATQVVIATADGMIDDSEATSIERLVSHVHKTVASVLASVRKR